LAQNDVELILSKQLASCLAMPMFVLNSAGDLLFFNESAEPILGRRFDEVGVLLSEEWFGLFQTSDDTGAAIKYEDRPMVIALEQGVPAHRRFWIRGLDGESRRVAATALPLIATGSRHLGALGLFWEPAQGPIALSPVSRPRTSFWQQPVETILTRRLAQRLAMPVYLVDEQGELLYFNEAAGPILGRSFEEVASVHREELYAAFRPRGENGRAIDPDDHPLSIARMRGEPVHRLIWIDGMDGVSRLIAVTAIPLIGQSGRKLGAFGVFWEAEAP
jgi:PAS domain-containing protein